MRAHQCLIFHASRFPDRVAASLRQSLLSRRVDQKFHYESRRQARQWLALHEAHSPARRDAGVQNVYAAAFEHVTRQRLDDQLHVIGLGSGGGQKEVALLSRLTAAGRTLSFTAVDVSPSLVLTSLVRVEQSVPGIKIPPEESLPAGVVCDLGHELNPFEDFESLIPANASRVCTFFGMLPNFEPGPVLERLGRVLRHEDHLLLSANLAPGDDYSNGVRQVLPQYDNCLTRDWLMTLLIDLGLQPGDGTLLWEVETCPLGTGLLRIAAWFRFDRDARLRIESEEFPFAAGERLQLFFSYRHTPERLKNLLISHALAVTEQWISPGEEEGVFLVKKLDFSSSPAR